MKLIDEKGRLFGKVNVIDLLVILFIISLTPMIYYGYKIFNVPPPPPPSSLQNYQTKIQVFILFKNLPDKIVKKITVNDRELDGNGKVIAEIVGIEKIEPNTLLIGGGQKEHNMIIDNTRSQVLVKMLISANAITNNQLLYKGEVISEGKMITFKADKYTIEGILNRASAHYVSQD
ncbi:MAG: DUF4330 domain-containing protein, partial [Nitrospinota bacterium]